MQHVHQIQRYKKHAHACISKWIDEIQQERSRFELEESHHYQVFWRNALWRCCLGFLLSTHQQTRQQAGREGREAQGHDRNSRVSAYICTLLRVELQKKKPTTRSYYSPVTHTYLDELLSDWGEFVDGVKVQFFRLFFGIIITYIHFFYYSSRAEASHSCPPTDSVG